MGKDFTPLRTNGASQEIINKVYKILKRKEVIEASSMDYFDKKLPSSYLIEDIEIGDGTSTKESIVRFKDGTFVVFKGTIKIGAVLHDR